MKNKILAFAVASLLFPTKSIGQSDTGCLTDQEREKLSQANKAVIAQFDNAKLSADFLRLRSELQNARTAFEECRINTIIPLIDLCGSEIRRHNALVNQYNAASQFIEKNQQFALAQVRINRAMYRSCN